MHWFWFSNLHFQVIFYHFNIGFYYSFALFHFLSLGIIKRMFTTPPYGPTQRTLSLTLTFNFNLILPGFEVVSVIMCRYHNFVYYCCLHIASRGAGTLDSCMRLPEVEELATVFVAAVPCRVCPLIFVRCCVHVKC